MTQTDDDLRADPATPDAACASPFKRCVCLALSVLLWGALAVCVWADARYYRKTAGFRADRTRCDICGARTRYSFFNEGQRCWWHAARRPVAWAMGIKIVVMGLLVVSAALAALRGRGGGWLSLVLMALVTAVCVAYAVHSLLRGLQHRLPRFL